MTRRDDQEWDTLARNLRRRRRMLDLTQQQVAESIGTYRSSLCVWEMGKHRPSAPEFLRWVAALGLVVTLTPKEGL